MTNEFAIKVLKELRGYGDKFANIGFDRKEALDMAIKALEQQPKSGKWIEQKVCNCYATLKCSVCDRIIEPTFTYGGYSYEDIKEWYPFCHCGADMRGESK